MSVHLIFRALKSLPPESEEGVEDFFQVNFTKKPEQGSGPIIDRNLSVYVVEPPEVIKILTEHYISLGGNLTRRDILIIKDTPSTGNLVKWPGKTKFTSANNKHHELRFKNDTEVRNYVNSLVKNVSSIRLSFPPLVQYKLAAHFIESDDPEWKAIYESDALDNTWKKQISKELQKISAI